LQILGLEFWDGFTPLNNNSMTGFRLTLLSADLFKMIKSMAVRSFLIRATENRAVHVPVCLTVEERKELQTFFPNHSPFPSQLPVAKMRLLLQEYCTVAGFEYNGRQILTLITHTTGDVKAINGLLNQDNKCCCCQMPYEDYHHRIYGCPPRNSETNAADWKTFLADAADMIAYIGINDPICKSLNQVLTLPQLLILLDKARKTFAAAATEVEATNTPSLLLTSRAEFREALGSA
jgi:hypothetical protein